MNAALDDVESKVTECRKDNGKAAQTMTKHKLSTVMNQSHVEFKKTGKK